MSEGGVVLTPITGQTAYATLDELRADPALKLAEGETADDMLLQDLLDAVKQFIDTETGRVFALSTDNVRHFDARRDVEGRTLYLKDDLCQITEILNGDGDEIEAGEYTTLPSDTTPYYAIKLKSSSGKSWTYTDDPEDAITITGRHSYAVSAPLDIKRANIIGAAALYKMAASGDGDRPILAGGGIVIEPSRLPATFWKIVNNYKRQV